MLGRFCNLIRNFLSSYEKKDSNSECRSNKAYWRDIARSLDRGCVISLEGNLGAGKTVLTKGIAEGLGVTHTIQSPTFVLMKVYPVKRPGISYMVHVDCYRVAQARELSAIGLEDYLHDENAVVVIEWADKIRELLPEERIEIRLSSQGEKKRTVTISPSRPASRNSKQGKVRILPTVGR
jgi:tRNA threonylcarbamoyladenosine biosynthesis protein TsaE